MSVYRRAGEVRHWLCAVATTQTVFFFFVPMSVVLRSKSVLIALQQLSCYLRNNFHLNSEQMYKQG